MKEIFADFYNKVLSFFSKADEKTENAKDVACNRLKLVLMQDRTNLTPAIMDRMRTELIELLSKYMELDRELLDLNFEHEDEQMALMLSIPVIRAKNEDEINEILAKEDEERQKLKELLGEADDDEEDDEDDEEEDFDDEEDVTEESDEGQSKKARKKEKFFKKKKGNKKDEEASSDADDSAETAEADEKSEENTEEAEAQEEETPDEPEASEENNEE